jgi:hypothetical protein
MILLFHSFFQHSTNFFNAETSKEQETNLCFSMKHEVLHESVVKAAAAAQLLGGSRVLGSHRSSQMKRTFSNSLCELPTFRRQKQCLLIN